MKKLFLFFGIWLSILPAMIFGQRPSSVPYDTEPVRFFESPANIIIYIVLPLLIVLIYILWRRKVRKEKEDQKEKE